MEEGLDTKVEIILAAAILSLILLLFTWWVETLSGDQLWRATPSNISYFIPTTITNYQLSTNIWPSWPLSHHKIASFNSFWHKYSTWLIVLILSQSHLLPFRLITSWRDKDHSECLAGLVSISVIFLLWDDLTLCFKEYRTSREIKGTNRCSIR